MAYVKDNDTPKTKLFIRKNGVFSTIAVVLFGIAIVLRLIEYWGFWRQSMSDLTFYTMVLLPTGATLLFILLLIVAGEKLLWLTLIPACLISVFFIITAFSFEWWRMISYILLYLILAVVYVVTVTGRLRTRWLLILLSILPPAYQICIEARQLWLSGEATANDWFAQLGLLCLMLAMLSVSLGMRRVKPLKPIEDVPAPRPANAAQKQDAAHKPGATQPPARQPEQTDPTLPKGAVVIGDASLPDLAPEPTPDPAPAPQAQTQPDPAALQPAASAADTPPQSDTSFDALFEHAAQK